MALYKHLSPSSPIPSSSSSSRCLLDCGTESEVRGEAPRLRRGCRRAVAVRSPSRRVTQRLQSVTFTDTPQTRRWVYPTPFFVADAVDSFEKLEMAIDPDGWISRAQTYAAQRQKDDTFIAAFFGTAQTATTSGQLAAQRPGDREFPFPAAQIVSVNCGSSGFTGSPVTGTGGSATGMNVPKLRGAKFVMLSQEVDLDFEMPNVAMSAQQLDNMLNQAQAISLDFNETPVLVDGTITKFMGFRFLHSERLPIHVHHAQEPGVGQVEHARCDLAQEICPPTSASATIWSEYPWQVSIEMMIGATRLARAEGNV